MASSAETFCAVTCERMLASWSSWLPTFRVRCTSLSVRCSTDSGASAVLRKEATAASVRSVAFRNFCVAAADGDVSAATAAARSSCTACMARVAGSPARSRFPEYWSRWIASSSAGTAEKVHRATSDTSGIARSRTIRRPIGRVCGRPWVLRTCSGLDNGPLLIVGGHLSRVTKHTHADLSGASGLTCWNSYPGKYGAGCRAGSAGHPGRSPTRRRSRRSMRLCPRPFRVDLGECGRVPPPVIDTSGGARRDGR
ncbi:Uncharacterised protein [Mycobacterium tuberculosis]|nr:Uncharacterised protein [Mycobacterium tuberculosis]